MKIFKDLPALVQALPELAASDWVDMPAAVAAQLNAQGATQPVDVLTQPALRFVLRSGDDAPRMGYAPWLPVAVLAQMGWPSPSDGLALAVRSDCLVCISASRVWAQPAFCQTAKGLGGR